MTADRRRVVLAGDPAAAFLLAAKGDEIPKRFESLVAALTAPPVEIATANNAEPVQSNKRKKK